MSTDESGGLFPGSGTESDGSITDTEDRAGGGGLKDDTSGSSDEGSTSESSNQEEDEGVTDFQAELAARLGGNRKALEQSMDVGDEDGAWQSEEEPKKEKEKHKKKKKKKKKRRERTASKVSEGSSSKRSAGQCVR